jgi:hypothetical protein
VPSKWKELSRLSRFIKSTWTAMNIRAGKYRHLQTKDKCKTYENITIEFTREEYKQWCVDNRELISSLRRPSLDRKDKKVNYRIDNIQVIELVDNIGKEKRGSGVYEGITKHKKTGHWEAQITVMGKRYYIGRNADPEVAHQLYLDVKQEWYGGTDT